VTPRSADTVLELVTGLDVVNNFAFQAHRRAIANATGGFDATPLLTFCNCYLTCVTAALGCPVPPMLANKQHAWLKSNEGKLAGWMPVDAETARQRAQLGYPTIGAATNPDGHGHVALAVPADPTGPVGIYVSSAGLQNYVRAPVARSFGVLHPEWFTHD
jgi:hypothetical protein